jgi:Fe-Mn family superoxide dismutase
MHSLPELPYALDALEPHLSRETLDYHYSKHHRAYVDKLNDLVRGSGLEDLSLETIIRSFNRVSGDQEPIFNNAAQAWNHAFYWRCLTPRKTIPGTDFLKAVNAEFGSLEAFRNDFTEVAINTFGSGWTWLVGSDDGRLEIVSTGNAGTPIASGQVPLLTCDVWEHAYYIDYRNARAEYLAAFWEVVNLDFVESNLQQLHASESAA